MEVNPQKQITLERVILSILILVFINLVILDLDNIREYILGKQVGKTGQRVQVVQVQRPGCDSDCLEKIYEATQSMKIQFLMPQPTIVNTQTIIQTEPGVGGGIHEFYVPVGSGSSIASDWTDVSGASAYIDSTGYNRIKSVTFEASVSIPTGNETVYVRLFNATDKHPVWFSDVALSGGTPQLLISPQITLDSGNKLYQVQMKTSLAYLAMLAQSRVHIVTY